MNPATFTAYRNLIVFLAVFKHDAIDEAKSRY